MIRPLLSAVAALALLLGQGARATCIAPDVADAARLHEFQTLMMDVALRCSLAGVAMRPDYEAMVDFHRARFELARRRLERFFEEAETASGAPHGGAYDRYATMLANVYGAGETGQATCRAFDRIAVELSGDDSGAALDAVARRMIAQSHLERATCATRAAP